MSDPNINFEDTLLIEFLDESIDAMNALDEMFIELESDPTNLDIVNAIFRPVHSMKGNSAFFGLIKVKTLTHEMETLLDLVRQGTLTISRELISTLLSGVDELKAMLQRVRHGEGEINSEDHFNQIVEEVKACMSQAPQDDALWSKVFQHIEQLNELLVPHEMISNASLEALTQTLQQLHGPMEELAQNQILPIEIKNIQALIAESETNDLTDEQTSDVRHQLEALKTHVQENAEAVVILDEAISQYHTFMESIGFDALLAGLIQDQLDKLIQLNLFNETIDDSTTSPPSDESSANQPDTPSAQPNPPKTEPKKPKTSNDSTKTMRVAESQIDMFLEYVGELLVVGDMFNHIEKSFAQGKSGRDVLKNFRRANETFELLSSDLQSSIMSIRKVEMRTLLQKIPRLVRDIASAGNKDIGIQIIGEQITVDKSLVDLLDAPLTHMVRNAADHGIEDMPTRQAKGKSDQGLITVEIKETDTNIVMTIQDDGAGLNYDAIQKKAESLEIVEPGQAMTKANVINLLFMSGVSTAETVTDISGRGVGMDVVRRMIEEANGSIDVESTPDEGSLFTISLPKSVTTQIMEGYLIAVADRHYVLPMNKIHETSNINIDQIKTITGQGRCVVRHDEILPVCSLRDLLDFSQYQESVRRQDHHETIMVTVDSNSQKVSMEVDEVIGVQTVVLRQIEGLDYTNDLFIGGALMGDGSIALILNPDALQQKVA